VLISVIDDDESMRLSLEGLVRSLGYSVQSFACAEDFLAAGADGRSACVISDIKMPGMSGIDLLGRLKETGRTVPVILMTAFANDVARARATKAGAACFLSKPFDARSLIECLDQALGN
jgi:FixJ family two-component response regulator